MSKSENTSEVEHDAHVRLFFATYTKKQRRMWSCLHCGRMVRNGDRARDASGAVKKTHCGCRTGIPGRTGTSKYGFKTYTADGKRLARVLMLPGYKPYRNDAHIRQYKLEQLRLKREAYKNARAEKEKRQAIKHLLPDEYKDYKKQQYNNRTKNLSNGYVSKRLKKNTPALKGVKFPEELINAERLRLMIVRQIKEMK